MLQVLETYVFKEFLCIFPGHWKIWKGGQN